MNTAERPWRTWKLEQYARKAILPCAYCGALLARRESTVDHVKPRSKGGLDSPGNYVISCKSCNDRKGNHEQDPVNLR